LCSIVFNKLPKKRKYTSKYAAVDNTKRIENAIREVQSEESTKKHASSYFSPDRTLCKYANNNQRKTKRTKVA